jgi:hypothetical protein
MTRYEEVELQLHPAVISQLNWEAALLGDGDAGQVLGERLDSGLACLEMGVVQPFWWLTPAETHPWRISMEPGVARGLRQWADLLGYPVAVLTHALLTASATEPERLRVARRNAKATAPPHPAIPLQDQDRSGYSMLGPYGSSLITLLRRDGVMRPEDAAVLLLAQEISRTGRCGVEPVSPALKAYAIDLVAEICGA